MKRIEWKLLCGFVLLALFATSTYAESPREQLRQMVEQLQQAPNDNALREKIIRLALELKPAPAVSDEAIRFEGRAQQMFKAAKSNKDYRNSVREYLKALNLAPWVGGYYRDICTILEKLGHYTQARGACLLYLKVEPATEDVTDVKRKLAGFEIPIENNINKKSYQAARYLASYGVLNEVGGYSGTLDGKRVTLAITSVNLDADNKNAVNQLKVSVQTGGGESSWFRNISDRRETISEPALAAVLSISIQGEGAVELISTNSSDSVKTTIAHLFAERKKSLEQSPVITFVSIVSMDSKDDDILWGRFMVASAVTGYNKNKTAIEQKVAFFSSNCNGELENGDSRQLPVDLFDWNFIQTIKLPPRLVLDCEAHSLSEAAWLEEIK